MTVPQFTKQKLSAAIHTVSDYLDVYDQKQKLLSEIGTEELSELMAIVHKLEQLKVVNQSLALKK